MKTGATGYWSRRWQGQAPWRTLFWRDIVAVGSAINLFTGFVALFLISQGQPVGWALAVHFAPLPYNLFMLGVVWRWPGLPPTWKWVAVVWFAVMLVI